MSSSISYNGTDLSAYGLYIVTSESDLVSQLVTTTKLPQQRAYAWEADKEPKDIDLKITVLANDMAQLQEYLDSIKCVLVRTTPAQLIFSIKNDRYYMATMTRFEGKPLGNKAFDGWLSFICADQSAYSVVETISNHNIVADPGTITETVGGSAPVYPIYRLTAGDNLVGVTILLQNDNTLDALEWTGSLNIGDYLEINCINWTVNKNGVVDMASVDGEFPYLEGGVTNDITVVNFDIHGTLRITYRNRYY